jgi:Xaa-Pro aminopeptidase
MTICVEPAGWFAGVGHLAAEETVLVTETAAELLSPPFPDAVVAVGA